MDKISIITVTYNCVDEIEMSIKSVLEQDYPNIEYIIIDGASTDGTVDIIRKYSDYISYWVSEPDKGLYYAMNKGIEVATGDWIHIHNAGGVYATKDTISKIFTKGHAGYDAIFGYIYSRSLQKLIPNPVPFYENKAKLKTPGYSHQALFVRTKWVKQFPFDVSFKCCADFNQAMTIYKNGARFGYINQHVYISAPAGFSERNREIQLYETAKINGIENSLWFKFYRMRVSLLKSIKRILKRLNK